MNKTAASVIIMVLSAVAGFFAASFVSTSVDDSSAFLGALLFAFIAGVACIIHTLSNKE